MSFRANIRRTGSDFAILGACSPPSAYILTLYELLDSDSQRAYESGVHLHVIALRKPTQNAFIESFNGRFRAEWLNMHWGSSISKRCPRQARGLAP